MSRYLKKAYVIDATAIFAEINPFVLDGEVYIPKRVVEEIRDSSSKFRLDAWISAGKVRVVDVGEESMKKAEKEAKKTGDFPFLSQADLEVIGLAIELSKGREVVVFSDDRGVQNVLLSLGIQFKGVKRKGVEKRIVWILYCPSCGRTFPPSYRKGVCDACGAPLRRKPRG